MDGEVYDPKKQNRVAPEVHKAVSDGVENWLRGILQRVSKVCSYRLGGEKMTEGGELGSHPRMQLDIVNALEKQAGEREKAARLVQSRSLSLSPPSLPLSSSSSSLR